jgi:hypothetical protein
MRFIFIGDTHGHIDLKKIGPEAAFELGLSADDFLIQCGDFGAAWYGDEHGTLAYWRSLPCESIICLGNHENWDWVEAQPLIQKYACWGYELGERIFAPLLGSIAHIAGKTFWFFPGGYSIDFAYRTWERTVFRQEVPRKAAAQHAIEKLRNAAPVDYVISHEGSRRFVTKNFGYPIMDLSELYLLRVDETRESMQHPAYLLDEVYAYPEWYGQWYFGHHHKDYAEGNIRCLYNDVVIEEL